MIVEILAPPAIGTWRILRTTDGCAKLWAECPAWSSSRFARSYADF